MFPKHPQTAQLVKTPGIEYLTYGILALLQSPLNSATKYSAWLESPSSPIYLLFPGSKSEFCFVETPKHLCRFSLDKPTLPHWFLPSKETQVECNNDSSTSNPCQSQKLKSLLVFKKASMLCASQTYLISNILYIMYILSVWMIRTKWILTYWEYK